MSGSTQMCGKTRAIDQIDSQENITSNIEMIACTGVYKDSVLLSNRYYFLFQRYSSYDNSKRDSER